MKRLPIILSILFGMLILAGANGCSSDPNVEGAKLDLRNKDYDRALDNLDTALEKNPANAEAYELKGRVYAEQAVETMDPDEHIALIQNMTEAFRMALQHDPTLEETVENSMRIAFVNEMNRGITAFDRGDEDAANYDTAAKYFRSATQIQPDSADAYLNLAYVLVSAGQSANAIEPFETAIEMGSNDPETYIYLAELYQGQGRGEEAVSLLEDAFDQFPQDEDIRISLLNAYQMTGRLAEALEQYDEAVAANPDNALFRYNYGSLLLEEKRYEEAIEHLLVAVEIDPEYGGAYYNLGVAHVNRGVDIAERMAQIEGEVPQALLDERRAEFAAAIPYLERAKALYEADGTDPVAACIALYQAYVQTEQTEKAMAVSSCAGYEDN